LRNALHPAQHAFYHQTTISFKKGLNRVPHWVINTYYRPSKLTDTSEKRVEVSALAVVTNGGNRS